MKSYILLIIWGIVFVAALIFMAWGLYSDHKFEIYTDVIIQEPTPTTETRADGKVFAYYRVWIEQNGERWPFTIQTQDTLIFIQLLQSDSLCIEVGACNSYGEYGHISRADVYRIQPDTLERPLRATTSTNYNWIVIPRGVHPMPARASDLASAIHLSTIPPTPCWTVSEWNATAQTFTHYTTKPIPMGDFPVYPGGAYRIEIAGSCLWKPTVRQATREGWIWTASEDDIE